MECNKEEAVRAKDMADKKMQNMDFAVARKIALKAQQLYPSLENIAQMLTVCEVHIAAERNMIGSDLDWYGILQVEQLADEASIKKQYRKLALQLHPDKNKFAGAESAFKLIGEAHRVLTDRTKRTVYDVKRRTNVKTNMPVKQAPPHQNKSFFARKHPVDERNSVNHAFSQVSGSNQPHQQQSQAPPTFWTACPFCGIKYQYYRTIMNRALRCQSCLKPFIAYDANAPPGGPVNQSAMPQSGQTASTQGRTGFQGNAGGGVAESNPATQTGAHAEEGSQGKMGEDGNGVEGQAKPKSEKPVEVNKRAKRAQPSESMNHKKRRKMTVESSESFDNDSSDTDSMEENVGIHSGQNPRRSARHKQNVTYSENGSDIENMEPPNSKGTSVGGNSGSVNGQNDEAFSGDDNKDKESEVPKDMKKPKTGTQDGFPNGKEQTADTIDYPEPEFHDFDKDRAINCFKVDQIWATYDDSDCMPRFYARIRRVYTTTPKLRITWLEAHPQNDAGWEWVGEELPYGCGFFETGETQNVELKTFSHLVTSWEKAAGKAAYKIYPKRGEIWALFKGWDINWIADPELHRQHEYEVVEVLSDYSEQDGVEVMYLVKLRGFTSLFQRASTRKMNSFKIPPHEPLRFSHRIPHFAMTGKERNDVPEGSVELDPASVPSGVEEVSPSNITGHDKGMDTKDNFSGSIPAEKNDMLATGHGNCSTAQETKVNGKNVHEKMDLDRRRSPRKASGCSEQKADQANGNNHANKTEKNLGGMVENCNVFDEIARESNCNKKLKADEKEKHLDAEGTSVDASDGVEAQADEKEKHLDAERTSINTSDCKERPADEKEKSLDAERTSIDASDCKETQADEKEKSLDAEGTSIDASDCKETPADEKEKDLVDEMTSVDDSDGKKAQANKKEMHLDAEASSDASESGGSSPVGYKCETGGSSPVGDKCESGGSSPVGYKCPGALFNDFESGRSKDKFKPGQIWAVYSKEDDGLPKYYVKITKAVSEDLEVHAAWLEDYATNAEECRWLEKNLPITCGAFRFGAATTFDTTEVFSHLVEADYVSKSRRCDIYPRKGEVWALYKNWSVEWTRSSLKNCEYEIVEVLEISGSVFKLLVLEGVGILKNIFRRLTVTRLVQRHERLRFSHRIPAFMLTDQVGDKLKGFWELDPAAVPGYTLSSTPS
ncbi:hypothetical protein ACLOJK_018046 [Asimina triloba]